MQHVFGAFARNYFESGLSVMPLKFRSKAAFLPDWQRFSTELPTEENFDAWEQNYSSGNIGLALGPVNGLVALDVDCLEPEILNLIPPTPCQKVGAKNPTYIYRAGPGMISMNIGPSGRGVEVLYQGRQTVLPPSIHPDTNAPYRWLGDDICDLSPDDLPILMLEHLEPIFKFFKTDEPSFSGDTGRNNKLKSMTTAAYSKGKSDIEVSKEIYEYDKRAHNPRLFTDRAEGFHAENETQAQANARKFVSRVFSSLARANVKIDPSPDIEIDLEEKPVKKFEFKPLPMPSPGSFLDAFIVLSRSISDIENSFLAIGGGLSLLSVICGNRFVAKGIWGRKDIYPNIYAMLIAGSGDGKSEVMKLVHAILSEVDSHFIGPANFGSSAGVYNCIASGVKLAIIDEASKLYRSGSTGSVFLDTVPELLNQVYTSAGSTLVGEALKDNVHRSVAHPYLSILAGTTPGIFQRLATQVSAEGGFFARCSFFVNPPSEFEPRLPDEDAVESTIKLLAKTLKGFIRANSLRGDWLDVSESGRVGGIFNPYRMELTDEAEECLKRFHEGVRTADYEHDFQRAFAARKTVMAVQYATLHAISRLMMDGKPGRIELVDVSWAIALIEALSNNSSMIFANIFGDDPFARQVAHMSTFIRSRGVVTYREVYRKFNLKLIEVENILNLLEARGSVKKTKGVRDDSPKIVWSEE